MVLLEARFAFLGGKNSPHELILSHLGAGFSRKKSGPRNGLVRRKMKIFKRPNIKCLKTVMKHVVKSNPKYPLSLDSHSL